jgi:hypothetical protein
MIPFNVSRGHATAGQNNVVMLPPEGEQVTKDGNYEPVLVSGHNENDKAAEIVDVIVTPPDLGRYINFAGLKGQVLPAKEAFELKDVVLINERNPPDDQSLSGTVELSVKFPGQTEASAVTSCRFELRAFPTCNHVFAVDFGNTSSTFVVLPFGSRQALFETKAFRALNLDTAAGEESTQVTAVQFLDFAGTGLKRWEVGNRVRRKFLETLSKPSLLGMQRARGFKIGGIKRLLGKASRDVGDVMSSDDGQTYGPALSGTDLNGYVLKRFIRRCEETDDPVEQRPIGRIGARRDDVRVGAIVATHPVNYTPNELDALRSLYREFLKVDDVDLRYDEATAAAIYYLAKQIHGPNRIHQFWANLDRPDLPAPTVVPAGSGPVLASETRHFNALVFDCGGGTTDIALMRVDIERQTRRNSQGLVTSNHFEVRPTVIGLSGLKDFAGDNMTLASLKLLRFRFLEKLVSLGLDPEPDPQYWSDADVQNLTNGLSALRSLMANRPEGLTDAQFATHEAVEEATRGVLPTNFARAKQVTKEYMLSSHLFYQLWKTAEDAKIALSQKATHNVEVPAEFLEQFRVAGGKSLRDYPEMSYVELRRSDLDELLESDIRKAWELATDLCKDLDPQERVHQVILAGNGSLYPLVKEMLRGVFAEDPDSKFEYQDQHVLQNERDAKFACAKGAAIAVWLESLKRDEHVFPDETRIEFRTAATPRLPFPILYKDASDSPETLFKRGTEFPTGRADVEQELRNELPAANVLALFQGLRQYTTTTADLQEYCTYHCPRELPDGIPADATQWIEVRVDRQYNVSAVTYWKVPNGVRMAERPLTRSPEPGLDAEARRRNPFLGYN